MRIRNEQLYSHRELNFVLINQNVYESKNETY
jgi:hypothetical protein